MVRAERPPSTLRHVSQSVSAVVGHRRSRRNIFGSQARLTVVRDGTLFVVDQGGAEQERLLLSDVQVRLTRGLVEVVADDGNRFHLYGFGTPNKVPAALLAQATTHPTETGVTPARGPVSAAAVSRTVHDTLVAHGARLA
jgi:hypothetical protein